MTTTTAGGQYVGGAACRTCHPAQFTEFNKTVHASIAAPKDAVTGCELCHGPGKGHIDGVTAAEGDDAKTEAAKKLIFSFNANPSQNAARCMNCHRSSRDQQGFERSNHSQHGVACNSCHSMHLTAAVGNPRRQGSMLPQADFFSVPRLAEENRWLREALLTKQQPLLCFGCHGTVQTQFALPTHHRVPEGLMKCTDCHSPHSNSNNSSLRQSGWETCAQCHNEKRGPFVFEHSAVKVQGCTACHMPHGSVNRNLLVRREERFLCLQCHVNPSAVNVPHGRLSFQTRGDCTRCHAAIHGSNFDANFLH